MTYRQLVREALHLLGTERMVLAIHDPSFPGDEAEDVGRGSAASQGGRGFLELVAALGFDAVQLGPQGETTRDNPSPYDATLMSRDPLSIPLGELSARGLLSERTLAALVAGRPGRGDRTEHRYAFDAYRQALGEVGRGHRRQRDAGEAEARELSHRLAAFRQANADWLEPETDIHALEQLLVHESHASLRGWARTRGLALYGDMQIGMSPGDARRYQALLVQGYRLGAPPSRTNPEGQPWGYPVLDPLAGAAMLVRRRVGKLFEELDAVRIDHPHGLVCPWVYRDDLPDPLAAVQEGARLYSSPDLPDHPRLAHYAIARPDQLARHLPRYADGWVEQLAEEQVDRYAALFDVVVECARACGRGEGALLCEVLSTQPYPLERVLARYGLGRFRITQKADLTDPADVYRSENARPRDWIMVGTHDTASLWALLASFGDDERARRASYLAGRLGQGDAFARRLGAEPALLAQAMFADLFLSPAANVMVFFADLLGIAERYNLPGTVSNDNWRLRVPPDYRARLAQGAAAGTAMDLRRALALALRAVPGEEREALAARLEQLPPIPP